MQVILTYNDTDSLTIEEVKRQAKENYGDGVKLEVRPISSAPNDLIYFAIQQMITQKQLSLLFDSSSPYNLGMSGLRKEILLNLTEILDQVILDNEAKVA